MMGLNQLLYASDPSVLSYHIMHIFLFTGLYLINKKTQ